MAYCSPDRPLTYFDTPSFLSTALHCISVFSIPTHVFGAYCIIFRTPHRMSSIKWSLLNVHFWTCLVDIGLSVLTIPFIIVPVYGGYPQGILTYAGVSTTNQMYIMTTAVALMGVVIVGIFENRYYVLISKNHWWRQARTPWAVMNYFFALTYFFPVYCNLPDQSKTKDYVLKMLPCLREVLLPVDVFLLNEKPYLYMTLGGSEVLFLVLQILIFCQLIHWNFSKKNCKLSAITMTMQKKLMRALVIQLAIPMCIIVAPLVYCIIASLCGYHNQALNNVSFITLSSHGFISTIAMISMHSPYRQVVLRLFRKPKEETSFTMSPMAAGQMTVFNIWRNSKFT